MRKPFVAGNWKMNKTVEQASLLVADCFPACRPFKNRTRIMPAFSFADGHFTNDRWNRYWIGRTEHALGRIGAFTGEPAMVKEFCDYVIVGHSSGASSSRKRINRECQSESGENGVDPHCVCRRDDNGK